MSETVVQEARPASDMHAALRSATRSVHERLESRLDIVERLADLTARAWLLGRFWGLHHGAETALAPLLDPVPELDYAARRKAPLLLAGLAELTGAIPTTLPICYVSNFTTAQALGFAYVMEGSSLGGRAIHHEMARRGQPMAGLGFFDAYGSMTGIRWRNFLAVLEREASGGGEAMRAEIIEGALDGFNRTETWLCDTVASA